MSFDPNFLFTADIMPPCSQLLGTSLIDYDGEAGWVKLGFVPRPEFANPRGGVQGGMLTAMLDELFSFATFIHVKGQYATPTIDVSTQFLKTVKIEPITGMGRVVRAGSRVVFTEAELYNAEGEICTKATASTLLIPNDFNFATPTIPKVG